MPETVSLFVTEVLNGTMDAISSIMPSTVTMGSPELHQKSVTLLDMGVLIGIVGDYPSRLMIEAKRDVYASLATSMYGMALEGEMLESFIGEVGNMVGGNMCTNVAAQGIALEITPPTLLDGQHMTVGGFKTALSVSAAVENIGHLRVSLLISE